MFLHKLDILNRNLNGLFQKFLLVVPKLCAVTKLGDLTVWFEWIVHTHSLTKLEHSAIRNLLLFLNSLFNREIFVNLKESIFFAQALKPVWSIVHKNSIVLYKEVTNIPYGKNCSDNWPKPFTKLSMFCVLADLVPSLLPFSTVPATVMLALPVLHRSVQYHKLSCFFQPIPFVVSY